jgi:GTP-binding protein
MKIPFEKAQFLTSALHKEEWSNVKDPHGHDLPEIAIAGRSNVGKSSLLNHLLGSKTLAKVSATPGKTTRINFFLIDEALLLTDLPGYGYAKVDKSTQKNWATSLKTYLSHRQSLKGLLLLLDIRRIPNEGDLTLIEWARYNHLPLLLVLTKTDKITLKKQNQSTENILNMIDYQKRRAVLDVNSSRRSKRFLDSFPPSFRCQYMKIYMSERGWRERNQKDFRKSLDRDIDNGSRIIPLVHYSIKHAQCRGVLIKKMNDLLWD